MSDYGTMQSRIADELARTDLTSQIALAIQTAIKDCERERFYFTETTGTFSTVASQEYYTSADYADIPNIVLFDSVKISVNGSDYTLTLRDFAYLDAIRTNSAYVGDPTDYGYYAQKLRLYPIPQAVRTMTLAYVKRLSTLSADADTNAWMTDAEELIRCRTKRELFTHTIRNYEAAQAMVLAENLARERLRGETSKRVSTGRLRPTRF